MTELSGEWLAIVNPMAGDGKGKKDWDTIHTFFRKYNIQVQHHFTEYSHHAVGFISQIIAEDHRRLIVVGGDGFLNEVVNGIFLQTQTDPHDISIAMIPVGTGNDWVRTHNIPFDYDNAVRIIRQGKTMMHDVGKVFYQQGGKEESRYFINICGMGFDAEVAKKVNADKGYEHTGPMKYKYHIFTALMGFECVKVRLLVDGIAHEHELFSLASGICQYNGGGMKQLPFAIPDDGIFDISLIEKVSRLKIIRNVKNLYDGSFTRLDEVKTYRGKTISLESDHDIWIEVDGESLGHSPFRFEMLKQAVKVIVP